MTDLVLIDYFAICGLSTERTRHSSRARFTGKERDSETGWIISALGTSMDPGVVAGSDEYD